jgi:hypothetical protein
MGLLYIFCFYLSLYRILLNLVTVVHTECDSTCSFLLRISLARTAVTILTPTLIFRIVIFCPHNTLAFSVDHKISINYTKISPITAPSCPEVSRKLRLPDYVTMAQNGSKVVSLTHRPFLPPGNTPGTHFC